MAIRQPEAPRDYVIYTGVFLYLRLLIYSTIFLKQLLYLVKSIDEHQSFIPKCCHHRFVESQVNLLLCNVALPMNTPFASLAYFPEFGY